MFRMTGYLGYFLTKKGTKRHGKQRLIHLVTRPSMLTTFLRGLPNSKTGRALLLSMVIATAGVAPNEAVATNTKAPFALLYDMQADKVLLSKQLNERMYPASMTKVMTAYLVMERLKNGSLTMEDTFKVSEKAWRKGGSKMFVLVNKNVSIADLLRGVIVQSGNDAAIVLAEGIAGSEEAFARLMNAKAKELGMHNTNFLNPTGWPDDNHYTTARDLLILAKRIITDFPEYYPIFAEEAFEYAGIFQKNRNPILNTVDGADGLKTGHTEAAGYGFMGTAKRGDRRLVVIVGGLDSKASRAAESKKLLDWGFRAFKPVVFAKAGQTIMKVPVWLGERDELEIISPIDIVQLQNTENLQAVNAVAKVEEPIHAPISDDHPVGVMEVDGKRYPLLPRQDVDKLPFDKAAGRKFNYLFTGDFY